MKKITGILELAMPHTLVLLDELGAGTDLPKVQRWPWPSSRNCAAAVCC